MGICSPFYFGWLRDKPSDETQCLVVFAGHNWDPCRESPYQVVWGLLCRTEILAKLFTAKFSPSLCSPISP